MNSSDNRTRINGEITKIVSRIGNPLFSEKEDMVDIGKVHQLLIELSFLRQTESSLIDLSRDEVVVFSNTITTVSLEEEYYHPPSVACYEEDEEEDYHRRHQWKDEWSREEGYFYERMEIHELDVLDVPAVAEVVPEVVPVVPEVVPTQEEVVPTQEEVVPEEEEVVPEQVEVVLEEDEIQYIRENQARLFDLYEQERQETIRLQSINRLRQQEEMAQSIISSHQREYIREIFLLQQEERMRRAKQERLRRPYKIKGVTVFVRNQPSSFKDSCPICLNKRASYHMTTECGHTFCRNCITNTIEKVNNKCPLCRDIIKYLYQNKRIN